VYEHEMVKDEEKGFVWKNMEKHVIECG